MSDCQTARLTGRSLVHIGGADATRFLQGILTCEVELMEPGGAAFGALLTPQGKILFDFFLLHTGDGYLADVAAGLREDFVKRLGFYRLRAKVDIEPVDDIAVYAVWGANPPETGGRTVADPRLPAMGWRCYGDTAPPCGEGDYERHRIGIGMPAGGVDFSYGDAFPHEVLMDQFRGVDFAKGCFVGQEVVSRMQHRGTARKRIVKAQAEGGLPAPGTEIRADGRTIGTLGGTAGAIGLAMVRLDRAAAAMERGLPITADETPLSLALQDFVDYGWPQADAGRQASQQ